MSSKVGIKLRETFDAGTIPKLSYGPLYASEEMYLGSVRKLIIIGKGSMTAWDAST